MAAKVRRVFHTYRKGKNTLTKPKTPWRSRGFLVSFAAIACGVVLMSRNGVTEVTTLPTVNMSPGQAQPITCNGGRPTGWPSLVKCYTTTTTSSTTPSSTTTSGPTTSRECSHRDDRGRRRRPRPQRLRPRPQRPQHDRGTHHDHGSPTTTTAPSGGNCTDPVWSSSDAEDTDNTDPNDGRQYWWVDNDAWNGGHGPQTIYVCNQSSWYATSNQPNNGGAVETYPDTEYDVGTRQRHHSTKPISASARLRAPSLRLTPQPVRGTRPTTLDQQLVERDHDLEPMVRRSELLASSRNHSASPLTACLTASTTTVAS